MGKASETGGVKPMSIVGRLSRERERLVGMTAEERAFRAQYLKDQILAPNEPKHVPELYKSLNNPIRRLYKWPLDMVANIVRPVLGADRTVKFRYVSGKAIMFVIGAYLTTYYFKYNANEWTRKGGWRPIHARSAILPGDEGFPRLSEKSKGSDYADKGFNNVKLNL